VSPKKCHSDENNKITFDRDTWLLKSKGNISVLKVLEMNRKAIQHNKIFIFALPTYLPC
jgi:hypothetical protein